MSEDSSAARRVAVVGGGPAGLMAAEVLAAGGAAVDLYDTMPSVGRKFLLAGIGGLNLTHGEPFEAFLGRYAERRVELAPALHAFGPAQVQGWAAGLGVQTFVGSSGRVFPTGMKAAPLLRAWLHRLRGAGVRLHMRHRWLGWADRAAGPALRFATPQGPVDVVADAVVLALGGASRSRLGSDGAWVPLLAAQGVDIAPLRASNCGFDVARPSRAAAPAGRGCDADQGEAGDAGAASDEQGLADEARPPVSGWTEHFRSRFAGQPLKTVALSTVDAGGNDFSRRGEFIVTDRGVEGSLIYAASALLVRQIERAGRAIVHIDLLPARSPAFVHDELVRPRGPRSLATHLKTRLGIAGVKAGLLHELLPRSLFDDPGRLAQAIKSLPLTLVAPRPIDEAISSAGGVRFEALDRGSMLRVRPGVFCAGEMLDWDAPTGGYLLTACLATGAQAARDALAHLRCGAR